MDNQLIVYLKRYGYENKYEITKKDITCSISFLKLRNRLFHIGQILEENIEEQIYVVSINAGVFGLNNAIVVCGLSASNLTLIGYAKEGLIKQHTCEEAMRKIEEIVNER